MTAVSIGCLPVGGLLHAASDQPAAPAPLSRVGFERLEAAQTGLNYINRLAADRVQASQILVNGSGVAAGDVDGDGWTDLYFCGLDSDNRLYRNLGGWKFEDTTAKAGVACAGLDATGAAFADLDGDGDLDLVVNSVGGGTQLFFNDGRGLFSAGAQVLNADRGGSSMALGDTDGDGDLDLYVANYRASTFTDEPFMRFTVKRIDGEFAVTMINGRPLTDPELTNRFNFKFILEGGGRGRLAHEENGEPDALYLNDGHGRFRGVPFTDGTFLDEEGRALSKPPYDWGLTAALRDLNQDGHPDLYVCNDFHSPDRLWLSDGQGHFRAAPPLTLRQIPLASMSVDFADLNRDGRDEILAVDMLSRDPRRRLTQRNLMRGDLESVSDPGLRPQVGRNTLQLDRGDGTYAEIAQIAGIEASEWSWAAVFLDVDLDGWEDLLVGNGFERDNINLDAIARIERAKAGARLSMEEFRRLRGMFPRHATPNLAFRNLGRLEFEEVGERWGFHAPTISQGICLADLDNDGDLDVAVNNLNDPASLYRNRIETPRLPVRLKGLPPNTQGIGARIRVYGGPVSPQSQEIMCGSRYLSGDDTLRVFAAGSPTARLRVEVDWRSGRRTVLEGVRPGQVCLVDEAAAEAGKPKPPPRPEPWFSDQSSRLNHRHQDAAFDDFGRQPLLPKRLSHLGPGIAWFDLDGDGWDDLVVSAGRGGTPALFRNDGQGDFKPFDAVSLMPVQSADQSTVLGGLTATGKRELLFGLAPDEGSQATASAVMSLSLGSSPRLTSAVSEWSARVGPLALADLDGNGELELFAGGRGIAGRYPEPTSSAIFRRQGDQWIQDEVHAKFLTRVGLVSGARWTDIDADGWPDLCLACEWGPLMIFRNENGVLQPWDPPLRCSPDLRASGLTRLSQLTGWWQGIAAGDFDGDGALDLIATNWGLNSRYEWYGPHPLRVYYGDYDGDGVLELVEAGFDASRGQFVPNRWVDFYSRSLPFLLERFPTHASWAETDMDNALGEFLTETRLMEAVCRQSVVLLNRRDHFEVSPLPREAQFSPAFAACVADVDGDGREDVFLSQNFFGVDAASSRYDAGTGIWLRGDGRGGFEAVPATVSGIHVSGEQRGAALSDYDADGRVDLVIAQNAGPTRLYRNRMARPGLRVRLQSIGNGRPAVGAAVRLKFGERWGPVRDLHAGSGYWSQDSAILVMAQPEPPTALWIRWPQGRTELVAIEPDSREILVQWDPRLNP